MADNEFNFYNSENDGYRGGFGDYADPSPAPVPGPVGPGPESPRKRPGRFTKRAIALLLAVVALFVAMWVLGGDSSETTDMLYSFHQ